MSTFATDDQLAERLRSVEDALRQLDEDELADEVAAVAMILDPPEERS